MLTRIKHLRSYKKNIQEYGVTAVELYNLENIDIAEKKSVHGLILPLKTRNVIQRLIVEDVIWELKELEAELIKL